MITRLQKILNARYELKQSLIKTHLSLEEMYKSKQTCWEERLMLDDARVDLELVLDNFELHNEDIDSLKTLDKIKKKEVENVKSAT